MIIHYNNKFFFRCASAPTIPPPAPGTAAFLRGQAAAADGDDAVNKDIMPNKKKLSSSSFLSRTSSSFASARHLILLLISALLLMTNHQIVDAAPIVLRDAAQICGQTLSNSDGYEFCPSLGDSISCIGMNGPTVTGDSSLNCNGIAVEGSGAAGQVGVGMQDDATVTNCKVTNFNIGFDLGDSAATGMTLMDSEATFNTGHGVKISGTGDKNIQNTNANDNIYYGCFIIGTSSGEITIQGGQMNRNSQGLRVHKDVDTPITVNDAEIMDSKFHGAFLQAKIAITMNGGMISGCERHGILATRYGAPGKLTIMDMEVMNNGRQGIVASGSQPAPEIIGCIISGNLAGSVYARGVTAEVTCSNLDGTYVSTTIDETSVCITGEATCPDRTTMCGGHSLLFPRTVLAPGDFCGQTPSPGRYELDPNETYNCNGGGIYLENGVDLDCKGRTITGNGSGIGIWMADGDNTIANCIVTTFNNAVFSECNNPGYTHTMTNIETSASRYGLETYYCSTSILTDVTATMNTRTGIILWAGDGGRLTAIRPTVKNNPSGMEIYTEQEIDSVYTEDAVVEQNTSYGIYVSGPGAVVFNGARLIGNTSSGIEAYPEAYQKLHFFNIYAKMNVDHAIYIDGAGDNIVEGAYLEDNGASGIKYTVFDNGSLEVKCSEIFNNGENGIEIFDIADDHGRDINITETRVYANSESNIHVTFAAPPTLGLEIENVYACTHGVGTQGINFLTNATLTCDETANGCESCPATPFQGFTIDTSTCPCFEWWTG